VSGDLMAAFFDRVALETRHLYNEWREGPPAEVLERQRESVELIMPPPDPDELIAPTRAAT
jgi:hypothetical protein